MEKNKYEYIPKEAIDDLSYTMGKVSKKVNATNVLSGVYVKSASKVKAKTKGSSDLTAKILAMTDEEDKNKIILSKDVKEMQKYVSDTLITAFYLGMPKAYDFKGDYEYSGGIINLSFDAVKKQLTKTLKNIKANKFEMGLKYPQYDFEKLLGKPIIKDVEGKAINWGNSTRTSRYRLWIWKDCVIGQTIGVTDSKDGYYSYGNEPTLMGGYKSVQTSKASKLDSIAKFMAKDKDGYVKDNDVLYNGLGGANFDALDKNKIKYAKGGMTEHGLEIGDKIVSEKDKEVLVYGEDKKFSKVNLDKGKRQDFAKGGSVRRTNNSPILRYTNYEDSWVLNLVNLKTSRNQDGLSYKGGYKYGISRQGPKKQQEIWQFKTLKEANKKYDELVSLGKTYSKIDKQGEVKSNYAEGGEIKNGVYEYIELKGTRFEKNRGYTIRADKWNDLINKGVLPSEDINLANDWRTAIKEENWGEYTREMYSPKLDRLREQTENEFYNNKLYAKGGSTYAEGGEITDSMVWNNMRDDGEITEHWGSDVGGSNEGVDNIITYSNGRKYLVTTNVDQDMLLTPSKTATEWFAKGGSIMKKEQIKQEVKNAQEVLNNELPGLVRVQAETEKLYDEPAHRVIVGYYDDPKYGSSSHSEGLTYDGAVDIFLNFFLQRKEYMLASKEDQLAFDGHPAFYGDKDYAKGGYVMFDFSEPLPNGITLTDIRMENEGVELTGQEFQLFDTKNGETEYLDNEDDLFDKYDGERYDAKTVWYYTYDGEDLRYEERYDGYAKGGRVKNIYMVLDSEGRIVMSYDNESKAKTHSKRIGGTYRKSDAKFEKGGKVKATYSYTDDWSQLVYKGDNKRYYVVVDGMPHSTTSEGEALYPVSNVELLNTPKDTGVSFMAEGGEVKKKGNEMIIGGIAGVLLGIFLNR